MNTPVFPAWRSRLAPMGSRTTQTFRRVRSYTLCQLEVCFGAWIPVSLFPKAAERANSRDCHYTRWRTFWCMLWQALNPDTSGREVVRQLQALFALEGGPKLSPEDGAYCRAKARLPLAEFPKALAATAQAADAQVLPGNELQGRRVKIPDGSAVTMADTPNNRAAYPLIQCSDKPNFPMMRIVVLFSLASGAILALAQGSLGVSELSLLSSLLGHLNRGDILLGDRGFGYYPLIALLQHSLGVDFIGRTTRRVDGRHRVKRLGRNDWLVCWKKGGKPSPWLTALQWAGLPDTMMMRAVKGSCYRKGFRVRQVTVITTLVDPTLYPAQQIFRAYLRRWRLEMCLDDLKTTLKMDMMRSRSPEMVQKEVYTRLIAHNLIRCLIAQTATEREVPVERISFKGSLDTVRHFAHARARARSKSKREELWAVLLDTLADDLIPERLGRREPRAVKRKKTKYPRLNTSRKKFRDLPKRNIRRKNARLRKLGLM